MHDGRSTGTTVLVWLYGYPNMPGDLLAIGKITQMVPRDLLAMGKILCMATVYGTCTVWLLSTVCLRFKPPIHAWKDGRAGDCLAWERPQPFAHAFAQPFPEPLPAQ